MDLQGSLVDTNLIIYPTPKLTAFLENQNFDQGVPLNIANLIKNKPRKHENDNIKPIDTSLNKSEVETLNKIKNTIKLENSSKIDDDKNESHDDVSKTIPSNIDKETPDPTKSDETNQTEKILENKKGTQLLTSDVDWLYLYIKNKRSKGESMPYLHELLEGCIINLPENEVLKRNPDLEARCVKLRAQQEAREYRKMTKGVDNVRMKFPEDSISYQLKQVNRQLIAIGQFIISIFAGFLFGFKGVEWLIGPLDFGFRLLLGVMCALIIALAEIYFLAKKLNEELSVPETTQLGGPPKFVDEKLNENRLRKPIEKPHQD